MEGFVVGLLEDGIEGKGEEDGFSMMDCEIAGGLRRE